MCLTRCTGTRLSGVIPCTASKTNQLLPFIRRCPTELWCYMHSPAHCMETKKQNHLDQPHKLLGHVSIFMYLQNHRLLAAHMWLFMSRCKLKAQQNVWHPMQL